MDYFDSPECNPRGWSLVRIEELISDLRGGAPLEPEDFVEKGFPVLHKGAIKQAGQIEIDPNKKTFADEGFSRKHKNSIITRNHVAVTLRDLVPSGPAIGMMSYLINAPYSEYILAQGAYGFLVDTERVIPEYLVWLSNSPHYRRIIRKIAVGSTQIHVRTPMFTSLKIPLPPLTEQKRIASLLARADRLRQLRRTAHDLGDALLQSVFLEMFGKPEENPKGFDIFELAEIGTLDRGRSKNRPRNAPELYGGKYPFIQTGDITNAGSYIKSYQQTYSDLGLKQSKMWKAGTLAITIAANIAKTAILTFDACFPDSVVGFVPNKERTNVEYVQYWLSFKQKELEDNAPESAQKNINLEILRGLAIPVPPLSLQEEFAGVVARVESLRGRMGESTRQVEGLFESLLAEAFS